MFDFLVEDGTGVEYANSYITVAEYRSYLLSQGVDRTGDADSVLKVELIQGSAGADSLYGDCYRGERATYTQGLLFPRINAYYNDDTTPITGIPIELKKGTAELSYRSKGTDSVQPDRDSQRFVKKERNKVDVLEEDITYAGPGEVLALDPYPTVTGILKPITSCSSTGLSAAPYVGGLDYTNLDQFSGDTNAYQPSFRRGMDDNYTSTNDYDSEDFC